MQLIDIFSLDNHTPTMKAALQKLAKIEHTNRWNTTPESQAIYENEVFQDFQEIAYQITIGTLPFQHTDPKLMFEFHDGSMYLEEVCSISTAYHVRNNIKESILEYCVTWISKHGKEGFQFPIQIDYMLDMDDRVGQHSHLFMNLISYQGSITLTEEEIDELLNY